MTLTRDGIEVRAVIFDFDGVILDTESTLLTAWRTQLRRLGIELDTCQYVQFSFLGTPLSTARRLEAILTDNLRHGGGNIARRIRVHNKRLASRQDAMPGVRQLLTELRRTGVSAAIASASERRWVVGHLNRLRLADHFDAVVCREDALCQKPAPDCYQLAVEQLGVRTDHVIAVEDSPRGLASAQSAGLACLAVPGPVTRMLDFGTADAIGGSLSDVDVRYLTHLIRRRRHGVPLAMRGDLT